MAEIKKSFLKTIKGNEGFTLVELSVILTIVAIGLLASLELGSNLINKRQYAETNQKVKEVAAILNQYARKNGLPCPAPGNWAPLSAAGSTNAPHGKEDCDPTNVLSNGNWRGGTIPFATLGIDPRYYTDAYGNPLNYVMDITYHSVGGLQNSAYTSNLVVHFSNGGSINNAAYVIYSSGRNGFGAWIPKGDGAKLRINTLVDNVADKTNAGCGNGVAGSCPLGQGGYYKVLYDTYKARNGTPDDILVCETRNSVLGISGSRCTAP